MRQLMERGLTERRALAVVRMSASALRYVPRPDRNVELRERILALAQRHKRYGVGMIYLKLRQEQWSASRCFGLKRPTRSCRWTSCSTAPPRAGCSRL